MKSRCNLIASLTTSTTSVVYKLNRNRYSTFSYMMGVVALIISLSAFLMRKK